MAINKVKFGNQTLIDLTDTTATADKILTGFGAYGKDGVWMDGSLVPGADDGYVYQDQDNYVVLDDDEGVGVGVTPLSVTENGTYNAGTRRAYNPVTVNVQPTLQSKTVTPTESQQTITPDSGKYGLSQVVVNGIDAGYVGSSVPRKSSADVGVSFSYTSNAVYDYVDATVTAPAGYYSSGINTANMHIIPNISGMPTQSAVTITPTEARQTAAQSRRWLTGNITVAGISSTYVGSGVPTKSSANLTISSYSVIAPAGYYSGSATINLGAMIPTTSTTSSGELWDTIHATNTQVYVNMPKGYNDTSRYARIYADAGKATTPATTITAAPVITVDANGLITANNSKTQNVTPTVSAGYVTTGTAGTITVGGTSTYQLTTKSSADLTRSGATVTVPAGYYAGDASKAVATMTLPTTTATTSVGTLKSTIARSATTRYINIPTGYNSASGTYKIEAVANGAATTPATTITTNPTISVNSSGLITATAAGTSTITPTIIAGYVSTGTAGTVTVSGSNTQQLTTKAAATITPTTSNQTIASGTYLTGAQTIAGDANLIASNIKSGVTIFGVEGTAQSEPNLRTAEVTPTEETQVIIGDLDTDVLVANSAHMYLTASWSAGAQVEILRQISTGSGSFDSTTAFPVKYRFQFAVDKYKGSSSGPYIYNTIKIDTVVTFTELGGSNDVIGEISVSDNVVNKLVITRGGLINSLSIFVVFNSSNSESFSYAKVNASSAIQPLRVYRVDTTEYDGLSQVTVNPIPSTYIVPKYTYTISKNGTYDIRSYASAKVLVTEMPAIATILSGGTTTTEGYVTYNGITYYRTNRSFYFNKGDSVLLHAPQRGQDQGYYGDIYIDESFVRSAVYSYTTPSSITAMNIQKSGNDMYVYTLYDEAVADTYATQMITRTFTSDPFIIPDNITKIGSYAFYGASSLSQVYGSYITSIGSYAFQSVRGLYNVSFPRLTHLGGHAFSYCQSLSSFDAPYLSEIGSYAFASCYRLQTVSMPEVKTIGSYAFLSCSSLATAIFPSVSNIYQYAFSGCSNLSSINFPICTSIGIGAFGACHNISRVTNEEFPILTSLGNYRFRSCSKLTNVNLSMVAFVGAYTFGNCSSLTTVNMPSLTSIGTSAFYSCWELVDVSFPLVSQISSAAFWSCTKLSTLVLPVINKISGSTFWGCSNLLSLYLLNTSSVVNLVATTAFGGTPISDYTTSTGGVYGSIFVPASLYNSYISANNWSVYSSRFASLTDAQISAILGS